MFCGLTCDFILISSNTTQALAAYFDFTSFSFRPFVVLGCNLFYTNGVLVEILNTYPYIQINTCWSYCDLTVCINKNRAYNTYLVSPQKQPTTDALRASCSGSPGEHAIEIFRKLQCIQNIVYIYIIKTHDSESRGQAQ